MARSDNATGTTRPGVGNRVFFIVVLVVLFALILSAIFVPLGVFRARGEVMVSHGTVTVRRDLYVYWLSAYKYSYLAAAVRTDPSVKDTPAYWAELTEAGVTRAEEARADADEWIRRIVFACSLFEEEELSLDAKTREGLEDTYRRLLQYEWNTEKAYDLAAKKIGFTYETVRRVLLCQSEADAYVSGMSDDDFDIFCALADREVVFRDAAAKIDFASLPIDARLYAAVFDSDAS